jgi:hypothetical protein
MLTYEQRLDGDPRWAFGEGSRHFERSSEVQFALDRIVRHLRELAIPFAVEGAMAMFFHGYRRFTENVDLIVTRSDFQTICCSLGGNGYILPFEGARYLREAESGVRVAFHSAGSYPGDGKPKPVSYPDPTVCAVDISGIPCLALPKLIEIKIASGISLKDRLRDLADVQELIRHLGLRLEMAERLDPSVRDKFIELCRGINYDPDRA